MFFISLRLKKEIATLNENRMEDSIQSNNLSTELKSTKSIITKQSTRIDLAEKCIKSHRVEIARLKHMNDSLKNDVNNF